MTLTGTALAAALVLGAGTLPAAAQDVAPDMAGRSSADRQDVHTPETVPAGRSQAGDPGDALARPADPNRVPSGPRSESRPADQGTNAANVQTGEDRAQGRIPPMAERPAGSGQSQDEQAGRKSN